MKEFQTAWIALLLVSIMLFSCSTVRKTTDSHQVESRQTDNSVTNTGYTRETTTIEKTTAPTVVPGDSLKADGYVPVGDTGKVVSESDGMTVTTTSIPVKDSTGKTIGNKINTKATTKPKIAVAPVDKTTYVKETGSSNEQKDIETTIRQEDKTTTKTAWRLSVGMQIVIGLLVIAGLLFGIYKLWKLIRR